MTPPRTTARRMTPPPALAAVGRAALVLPALTLIAWSFVGLHFDFSHTRQGLSGAAEMVGRMFPHTRADWSYDRRLLPTLWDKFEETVQMAVAGTVAGAVCAFPVSFLAARTGSVPRPLSALVKTFLNASRAVPTIVYALIACIAIGLGPPAGAAAIAFVTFISLGKLYAESLESVAPGPVEAVRAAGGNGAQVFIFGMLPQVFPLYLSTTLYSLEYNLKDSFIIGIVGAGGLGQELQNAINLFQWLDAGLIIGLLVLLVNFVDYLSYRVRLVFS